MIYNLERDHYDYRDYHYDKENIVMRLKRYMLKLKFYIFD